MFYTASKKIFLGNLVKMWLGLQYELTLATILQDADSLADISQVERCLVVATHVLPNLSYQTKNTPNLATVGDHHIKWNVLHPSPIFIILRSLARLPVMR